MKSAITAPRKIVVFRTLQLGDLLCAVPALRALRSAYPQAHITLIGLPWAEAFVQRFSHYLDAFVAFPGWPGLPEQQPDIERIPAFLSDVQHQKFDLALQMQGSGTITNPVVMLLGARQAAGYYLQGQFRPNIQCFFPYPEDEHEIRIFLRLMHQLGIPSQGESLEFPILMEDRKSFERFQTEYHLKAGSYVCLHPGARFKGRRWPVEKFAAVGDTLARKGLRVIVTGTAAESELTRAVVDHMHTSALDAAGLTDLGSLALLLANARLLISNDTGVSHIAAALETPSVILFTVSDPNRWRPLDQKLHRVVINAHDASPEDVLAEANPLLQEARIYANSVR